MTPWETCMQGYGGDKIFRDFIDETCTRTPWIKLSCSFVTSVTMVTMLHKKSHGSCTYVVTIFEVRSREKYFLATPYFKYYLKQGVVFYDSLPQIIIIDNVDARALFLCPIKRRYIRSSLYPQTWANALEATVWLHVLQYTSTQEVQPGTWSSKTICYNFVWTNSSTVKCSLTITYIAHSHLTMMNLQLHSLSPDTQTEGLLMCFTLASSTLMEILTAIHPALTSEIWSPSVAREE